jgi:hypothetical protein
MKRDEKEKNKRVLFCKNINNNDNRKLILTITNKRKERKSK